MSVGAPGVSAPPRLSLVFGARNIHAKAVHFMKMKAQIPIAAVAVAFTAGLIAHAALPVGDAIDPWGNSYTIHFPGKEPLVRAVSNSPDDHMLDPWGNPYKTVVPGKEPLTRGVAISPDEVMVDPWGIPYKILVPGKEPLIRTVGPNKKFDESGRKVR